jgi:CSLREA domain-containing protein
VLPLLVSAPASSAATYRVDTLTDATDATPGDGQCRTAEGTCTLRAAVQEANAVGGTGVVILPAGRLVMSRPNVSPLPNQTADLELDTASGDIDIFASLTIRGAGADRTTIDARHLDRAFNVEPIARVAISDLKITNGDATTSSKTDADIALGGAILNTGTITLDRVALVGNHGDGGGGMFSIPATTTTVRDSLIADNRAVEGGGLRLDSGGTIINTTITGNVLESRPFGKVIPDEITGYGGGIDHRGGANLTIINSTITENHAYKAGGGLNSGQDYAPVVPAALWPFRVYLENTIIAGNTADKSGANCHVAEMVIESRGHNLAGDGSCFLSADGDLPGRAPRLRPLAANGGPTRTRALRTGSPAINAAGHEACPARDQRGGKRPQGAGCDIGAYEFRASVPGGRCTLRRRAHSWRGARKIRTHRPCARP